MDLLSVIASSRRRVAAPPALGGIIPDPGFDTGSVGSWVSARGTSSLDASTGKLLITKLGNADGAAIDLTGLISPGSWRLRARLISPGGIPRYIFRMFNTQALTSGSPQIYNDIPTTSDFQIDITFTVNINNYWFGVITAWDNIATQIAIDDLILEPA